MNKETINNIEFLRISNCKFGNPRFVFHFMSLASDYEQALKIAKKIGGKKFHNKQFGGGIVITSYNLQDDANYITANKIN